MPEAPRNKKYNKDYILIPLVVFILLGGLSVLGGYGVNRQLSQDERNQTRDYLSSYSVSLTSAVNRRLDLIPVLEIFINARSLASNLQMNFPIFAEHLQASVPGIRSIYIFPAGETDLAYPADSDSSGFSRTLTGLVTNRPEIQLAVERSKTTLQTVLSEPYSGFDDGIELVAVKSIPATGSDTSIIILRLGWPEILAEAGLNSSQPTIRVALRTAGGYILTGEKDTFQNAPEFSSLIFAGEKWDLAAIPTAGWKSTRSTQWVLYILSAVLVTLFSTFAAYRLSLSQARQRDSVERQITQLAEELNQHQQSQEEIRHLRRFYTVLGSITQAISENKFKQDFLLRACEISINQAGYDLAWFGFLSSSLKFIRPIASAGLGKELLQEFVLDDQGLAQNSPIARAIKENHPVIHDFAGRVPSSLPEFKDPLRLGYASMASFPIHIDRKLRGVFNLYSRNPHHFSESEAQMLEKLAVDISIALQNYEEEEQRRWAEAETIQINRLYQVLTQVNQQILNASNIDVLYSNICRILVELGLFKLAWIGWSDPGSDRITVVAQFGDTTGFLNNLTFSLSDPTGQSGPLSSALQSGMPFIAVDFENTIWKPLAEHLGFEAMGSFPIRIGVDVRGILSVHVDNRDYFRMKEINLLQEISASISFALENRQQEILRQKADLALAENYRLLKALINSQTDVIIFSLDRNYRYTTFNENHQREMIKIWNAQINIGDNILDFITIPELRQKAQQSFDRALNGETFTEISYQPDADIYYEFTWNPIRSENGQVEGLTAFIRNITEQKRTTQAIEQSERRYRQAQKAAHIGSWEWDILSNRLTWSEEMYEIFDKTPGEFTPTNDAVFENMVEEDKARVKEAVESALIHGVPYQAEYRIYGQGGKIKWVEARGEVTFDEAGHPIRAAGTVQDIGTRKNAELALIHSRDLMRYIIEHNQSAVAVHDKNLNYIYVSRKYLEEYKVKEKDIIGKHHYEVFPDLPQKWRDVHQKALRGEISSADDDPYERADGTIDYTRWECRPWYEADGSIGGIVIYTEVITARKQAEEKMRQTRDYLDSLITYANAPILTWDTNLKITLFNRAFERLTGYTASEMIGQELSTLFPECDREKSMQSIARTSEGEYLESVEIPILCKDGQVRIVLWNSANIYGKEKTQLIATIAQGQDITERLAAEDQLRALNLELERRVTERTAQLEASNKELESFAYSVSHDLRAPLRAIDGFSGILEQDYGQILDDEAKRLLAVIRRNTTKMDRLITDLLALSRVTRTQLNFSLIDMTTMAHSIYHEVATPEDLEKFELIVRQLPQAYADPILLRQVWMNLISNAIKYTRPQPIRRIEITGSEKGEAFIYTISDTGVGFNPKFADKLFGVFQRLHKESEFEGNGVGLAIVQRIIHRHGGLIWGKGEVGKGASFSFSIPKRQVPDE